VNKGYELYRTLKGHQRWVWDCVYTSTSTFLVTGTITFTLYHVFLTSFSLLVASSDHVARLWDLSTGEAIRHYSGHHKVRNTSTGVI